jgi:hypothetical protein
MIFTYTKDFFMKKMSLIHVLVDSQEYRMILGCFLLSYLVCSRIWLNHLMDDCRSATSQNCKQMDEMDLNTIYIGFH